MNLQPMREIVELFKKPTTRVKSIAFHPTYPTFITAHHCGTINIWNYLYNQIVCSLKEHDGSVRVVKIHPCGDFFATAGDDKIIRVWNYRTKTVVHKLIGHTDYIRSIDFHPTKPWLVSASDDCIMIIWDFNTGKLITTTTGHKHYIMSVLFIDSTHLVTCSLDHNINLWDANPLFEKPKFLIPLIMTQQEIQAHDKGINCLYMNGNNLISGSDERDVKTWKYYNNSIYLEKQYYAHEGIVLSTYCDGNLFYSGGEDKNLIIYDKNKFNKINIGSRVWAIEGKDNLLALGTDDGLFLYRNQEDMAFDCNENEIIYSVGKTIYNYNFKNSQEIFKNKENVKSIQVFDDKIILTSEKTSDILLNKNNNSYSNNNDYDDNNGFKNGSNNSPLLYYKLEKGKKDTFATVYKNLNYFLKDNILYKNEEIFHNFNNLKNPILKGSDLGIFILNEKNLIFLQDENEKSISFNFKILDVKSGMDKIAVFGQENIVFLDLNLKILHTIKEPVEITGGFFYTDFFIYCTLKQVKFFYEDSGIIQSLENYSIPICIKNDYLYLMTLSGIDKVFLNLSEIRFRRAVLNNDNIISVIETEQLPGLSPLEYLIKKGKGAIALPYIKDKEKVFELFLSDKNYEEAFKCCNNSKMFDILGKEALINKNYEIAENCYKKNNDNIKLFYLYISTKQFDKLKNLEGSEIETMCKIVLQDNEINIKSEFSNLKLSDSKKKFKDDEKLQDKNLIKNLKNEKDEIDSRNFCKEKIINKNKKFINDEKNKSRKWSADERLENDKKDVFAEKLFKDSKEKILDDDNREFKENKEVNENIPADERSNIKGEAVNYADKIFLDKNDGIKLDEKNEKLSKVVKNNNDSSGESEILSNLQSINMDSDELSLFKTDLATNNDSECNYFNLEEYKLEPDLREPEIIYQDALNLTTEGKFPKAIEVFKSCIYAIALNFKNDCKENLREKIGIYLLGLKLEKERRKIEDPKMNIEYALMFSNLDFEKVHQSLSKNLAMTTCFKHGNYKTAKKLAKLFPEGKNSSKILESEFDNDFFTIEKKEGFLCYDSLTFEIEFKQCFLCFNKFKEEVHYCTACDIGIVQH